MRKIYFQSIQVLLTLLCASNLLHAQTNLSGVYQVEGYIFHPTAPRALLLPKSMAKVGPNTYQTSLADYGYTVQFDLDSNNGLKNFVLLPGSGIDSAGFMTTDNPGGYVFPSPSQPGDAPWVHTTYDNTYDSSTHTFYMHYGYELDGQRGENFFTRQIYEKWVFDHPAVVLTSFTPDSGTSGTTVYIKGRYFTGASGVKFGAKYSDTFTVISDSEIVAVVGAGATGAITVFTNFGSGSIPGFTYTPPIVTDTHWVNAGNAGFSDGPAKFVSIALNSYDHPYVVFADSLNGSKARVMKLNDTNEWVNVGDFVSDGACSYTNLVIDNDNHIYVAFIDSLHQNKITVKTFKSSAWENVGEPGFAPCENLYSDNNVSIALDANNEPNVVSAVLSSLTHHYEISVMEFNGNKWIQTGNSDIGLVSDLGYSCIAIDRRSNTVYVVADDTTNSGSGFAQLTVKSYIGKQWKTVGSRHFTTGRLGAYFPDMVIDSSGNPLVCVQEDNGREQASVYKLNGSDWEAVGPRLFSAGHAYFPSIAVTTNNSPMVSFLDEYYNEQGTVMSYDSTAESWNLVGARGFAPGVFTQNALVINHSNIPYIAFPDKTKGNKASVMHFEIVLPVTLINFTAQLLKQNVLIRWQTGTEINTSHFNIQRSTDARNFINIGKIAAIGNSNTIHNYDFTDLNVYKILNTPTAYYRLQTVDKDNRISYSEIVPINFNELDISINLWPNPTKDFLKVDISNYEGTAKISIYNISGKKITEETKHVISGTTTSVTIDKLTSGTYFISIYINGKELKGKFIKQ